jgi:hypothetical protein
MKIAATLETLIAEYITAEAAFECQCVPAGNVTEVDYPYAVVKCTVTEKPTKNEVVGECEVTIRYTPKQGMDENGTDELDVNEYAAEIEDMLSDDVDLLEYINDNEDHVYRTMRAASIDKATPDGNMREITVTAKWSGSIVRPAP